MRSFLQGKRRSVDRGTCGPGIQPRKKIAPGRRRCQEKRKAPSGASISRDAVESRAVRDPGHVRKRLAREPGGPVLARRRWRTILWERASNTITTKKRGHRLRKAAIIRPE